LRVRVPLTTLLEAGLISLWISYRPSDGSLPLFLAPLTFLRPSPTALLPESLCMNVERLSSLLFFSTPTIPF